MLLYSRAPVGAVALGALTGMRPRLSPVRTCTSRRVSCFHGEALGSQNFLRGGPAGLPYLSPMPARTSRKREARAVAVCALGVGWLVAAVVGGVVLGLILAKAAQSYFQFAAAAELERQSTVENAKLRAKVEELQQLVTKYEPLAYRGMKLRFTKGINKAVILGLVDELLENKEVNIWWLPDSLERILYFNVISLMLSVLDEVTEGMSVNFAGHNVKLRLTYLDMAQAEALSSGERPEGLEVVPVM